MTEPLYLALFIWAVVYFNEFVQEAEVERMERRQRSARCWKCGTVPGGARASRATTDGFWRLRCAAWSC